MPVEVNPSDSMEAKELEVEQLIQQALNQVKSTSSIFERVARSSQDDILDILEETSIGTPEPETISEIAQNIFENTQQEALADIRQAMETAQAKTAKTNGSRQASERRPKSRLRKSHASRMRPLPLQSQQFPERSRWIVTASINVPFVSLN